MSSVAHLALNALIITVYTLNKDVFLDVFEVAVEFGMIKDRAISHSDKFC